MKRMHLCIETDVEGSRVEIDMGVSEEEWFAMDESDQERMVQFYRSTALDEVIEALEVSDE